MGSILGKIYENNYYEEDRKTMINSKVKEERRRYAMAALPALIEQFGPGTPEKTICLTAWDYADTMIQTESEGFERYKQCGKL
jgi:hypothetical protein